MATDSEIYLNGTIADNHTISGMQNHSDSWAKRNPHADRRVMHCQAKLRADFTCCGLKHITNFAALTESGPSRHKAMVLMLREACKVSLGRLMCSLSSEQNRVWENALEEAGYKLIEKFRNRNTNHDIFFYSAKGTRGE